MEPRYNEVLGTMKITLLYQVSHYIRVKNPRNIKRWDQQNYLVIRGFCYIRPFYNEVPLYKTSSIMRLARALCMQVAFIENASGSEVNIFSRVVNFASSTSVASFLVLGGGGGQDPQMYTNNKNHVHVTHMRERAPQKQIFSSLKINLHAYKINAVPFYYLWYIAL